MATSTNYEKQWKDWYTGQFMKACAAYAVAHDFSSPSGPPNGNAASWNYRKALSYEAKLKIPKPALKKELESDPPPPVEQSGFGHSPAPKTAYSKARDAFRSAAGQYTSEVTDAVKLAKERGDYVTGSQEDVPTKWKINGGVIREQMFGRTTSPAAAQGEVLYKMMKPILDTFLEIPEAAKPAIFFMGERFKFWNVKGSPNPKQFNVLISSAANMQATSTDAVWAPLKEIITTEKSGKKVVPLAYTGPQVSLVKTEDFGEARPWSSGHSAGNSAYEAGVIAKHNPLSTLLGSQQLRDAYHARYLTLGSPVATAELKAALNNNMAMPFVNGSPLKFKNISLAPQAEDWEGFEDAWKPQTGWTIPSQLKIGRGTLQGDAQHSKSPWKIPGEEDTVYTALLNHVAATSANRLFEGLQQMFLTVGRSTHKTGSGRSWYDQLVMEILWGLQDPVPPGPTRPSTGGSRPRRKPKAKMNVGKRKIRTGKEIHAIEAQCWLLENIEQLASLRESETYKNVGVLTHGQPANIVSKLHHGSDGAPATWPPRQGGPDSEAYTLQNMCPDLWALMTPHFELYRVNYLKQPGDEVPALVPQSEDRIPFSNFIQEDDLTQITAGSYGRLGGAGMKSFTWSLDGTQPAEVDNMISAQLTMHFQSVYDLFRHNKIPGTEAEYAAGIPDQPGYLDLIIGSGIQGRPESSEAKLENKDDSLGNVCDAINNEYVGENFRIKVICGWSTPPGFESMDIPGYTADDLKSIKGALEGSRRAFFLQIVSHEINFEQDGTLELVIQYQASMSGITRSPTADIFIGHELYKNSLEKLDQALTDLEEKHNDFLEAAEGRSITTGVEEEIEKEKQALLEKQIILMQKTRAAKYKEFLGSLAQHNKVRVAPADTRDLLAPLNKMTPEDRAKAAKVRASKVIKLENAAKAAKVKAKTDLEAKKSAEALDENVLQEKNKNLKRLADNAGFLKLGAKKTGIPFMYLGDLIDALLKSRLPHLIEEQEGTNTPPMQVVLGNVEMINPLLAYQIQTVKFSCPSTPKNEEVTRQLAQIDPFRFRKISGIWEYMNIGSIPISLDKFNEWFVNTVIRGKKESYKLLDFIRDVCAALITDAYSSTCFEKVFKFNITFNSSNFRMADSFKGCAATLDEMAHSARKAQNRDRKRLTPESIHGPSIPTAVFYSVDSRPMSGDRISDLQAGIYHYYLGGRCGLAKEINFQRQDMPGYRESRISKDGSLGAQQLKELYTVQMNMVGNTLQKNGTYVYIDPIAIGAGSTRALGGIPNIARLIGLGGYFLVNSVTNEISPAGYSTTVSAMQEMSAFDEGDNTKIVAINGEAPPIPQEPEPDVDPTEKCIVLVDWDNDGIGDTTVTNTTSEL